MKRFGASHHTGRMGRKSGLMEQQNGDTGSSDGLRPAQGQIDGQNVTLFALFVEEHPTQALANLAFFSYATLRKLAIFFTFNQISNSIKLAIRSTKNRARGFSHAK